MSSPIAAASGPSGHLDEAGGRRPAVRQEALLGGLLLALVALFTALEPAFLTAGNLSSTAQDATQVLLLAAASTYVIVAAGIDLSVGAVLGLSGVVAALMMRDSGLGDGPTLLVGVLGAVAVGGVCGAANGAMIARLRISAFVATLATLGVASGLTLVLTQGVDIGDLPPVAVDLGNRTFAGGLTLPIVITAVVVVVAGLFLHFSRFGRWTFAIGSDRRSAVMAGIPVRRHLIALYVLSGSLAGLAGFLAVLRLGVGSPQAGLDDELTAIAAVVIGGASLFGGVGSMVGSVLGALVLAVVLNGLIISGVQPYWQLVATGVLIAVAVAFQTLTRGERDETL